MSALHGHCLCGAITFDVHDPQTLLECHCTRCRQWTGSASVAVVMVPAANLELTAGEDQLHCYAEEGFSDRYFCSHCGSGLYTGGPDTYYIAAGVLKEVTLPLACHIQVENKAPWHEIGGDAPQFAQMPPAAR